MFPQVPREHHLVPLDRDGRRRALVYTPWYQARLAENYFNDPRFYLPLPGVPLEVALRVHADLIASYVP
eukprot:14440942-Alexandrium_andersonii.AAC.1